MPTARSSGSAGSRPRACSACASSSAALFQHPREASLERRVQPLARRSQQDDDRVAGATGALLTPLPFRKRRAGGGEHLEGAEQALAIARRKPRRGRIASDEHLAEAVRPELGMQPCGVEADLGRHRRDRRQALEQRFEIKAGAADNDGQPPRRLGRRQLRLRQPLPAADRAGIVGGKHAEQAVRRPRFVRGRGPRGQHPRVAVDLHAVGVDDGAGEGLRHGHGQRRLAAAGRPGDDDHRRLMGRGSRRLGATAGNAQRGSRPATARKRRS